MSYKNYISLGYFCNVASDLEELGLRNTSSPFDWNISLFEGVIKAIDNEFDEFMMYDNIVQSEKYRQNYYDPKYKMWFFHDFNKYEPLKKQYSKVKEKYDRRILRFLNNINEPTLFFRYIFNEPGFESELNWIEKNYAYIEKVIKKHNTKNRIIYIGDELTHSDIVSIFNVQKDKDDLVSRHPIINNIELKKIIDNESVEGQLDNIKRFRNKELQKKSLKNYIIKRYRAGILAVKNQGTYKHEKSHYWDNK
ncbi:hypothetical protein HCY59_09550 [Limosilactobacillus fermentum]